MTTQHGKRKTPPPTPTSGVIDPTDNPSVVPGVSVGQSTLFNNNLGWETGETN